RRNFPIQPTREEPAASEPHRRRVVLPLVHRERTASALPRRTSTVPLPVSRVGLLLPTASWLVDPVAGSRDPVPETVVVAVPVAAGSERTQPRRPRSFPADPPR